MPSLLIRVLLFASSYLPLFVILSVRHWEKYRSVCIGLLVLGAVSLAALVVFWLYARKNTKAEFTIVTSSPNNAEAMSYIVSYIIPFLDLPFDELRNAISLAVFFFMLGVIYVQSNMIHINPLLNLMGWFIYEVETDRGTGFSLVTRRRHVGRGKHRFVKIGDNLLLEVRDA